MNKRTKTILLLIIVVIILRGKKEDIAVFDTSVIFSVTLRSSESSCESSRDNRLGDPSTYPCVGPDCIEVTQEIVDCPSMSTRLDSSDIGKWAYFLDTDYTCEQVLNGDSGSKDRGQYLCLYDDEPPCTDECPSLNYRECTDGNHYRNCGADYDDDSCLEWSNPIACDTGYNCENGACQAGQCNDNGVCETGESQAICTTASNTGCSGGDVYKYDDCNENMGRYIDCLNNDCIEDHTRTPPMNWAYCPVEYQEFIDDKTDYLNGGNFYTFITEANKWFGDLIAQLNGMVRPLSAGIRLEHERDDIYAECSLGMIVEVNNVPYILTAGHCVTKGPDAFPDPEDIGLDTRQGGIKVGNVYRIDNSGAVDAALISIDYGVSNSPYKDYLGNQIIGFGGAINGLSVYKIGASTGLTYGTVTGVGTTWSYDKYGNEIPIFEVQGDDGNFADSGDSGAAIISTSGHYLIGIISAGGDPSHYSNLPGDIKSTMGID